MDGGTGAAGENIAAGTTTTAHDAAGSAILAGAAVVGAVVAAVAGCAPTGHGPTDVLLTGLMAAAVVVLGAHAGPLSLATAGLLAVVAGAPTGWSVAAVVAVALAGGCRVLDLRIPPIPTLRTALAATASVLVVGALVRLEPDDPERATAVVAALGLGFVAVSGWRRLPSALRRPGRWVVVAVVGLVLLGAVAGGGAGMFAVRSIADGVDATDQGLLAIRDGDQAAAAVAFRRGEDDLASAREKTRAWWALPARHTPLVAQQLAALDAVADGGARTAGLAADGSDRIDSGRLRLVGGRLDPQVVADAEPVLRSMAAGTGAVRADFDEATEPSVWHLPVVTDGLDDFDAALADAQSSAETGALAAEVGPDLLGADGVARYLVAFVSPSEARGTGFMGNYGVLTVTDGRIELAEVGRNDELDAAGSVDRTITGPPDFLRRYLRFRPQQTWENITFTPDGPTAAQVMAEMYPQSGGTEVDGVIRIDPTGLSRLLRLTGPIDIEGLPYRLDSRNVVSFLQVEQYRMFEVSEQRSDLLGRVAQVVFERLTTGDGPAPAKLARNLGPAVEGGHVSVWLRSPRAQSLIERLGATAAVPAATGDGFGVVSQNAGGGKIDVFMERSISYDATVDAATGRVEATATVALHNTAPTEGEPAYLTGNLVGLPEGSNRSWVSMYSPLDLAGATADGKAVELETEHELGRNVWSQFVDVAPGATVVLRLELTGTLDLTNGYRFDLLPQVTVRPDEVDVAVRFEGAVPTVRPGGRRPDGGVRADGATLRAGSSETQGTWSAQARLDASG